jgi:hypothetical protein
MKLTTFLVSAVLALGVAAIEPEAGNDVEVRDFSGEILNEFDAREEEELDVRDEEDLETRNYDYNPCKGSYVEYKAVNYKKQCVCTRSGEVYNKHKGCECKWGYEYSETYKKCIPKCKYGEVYNEHTGKCEKPFSCKGDNVEIVDNYGEKSCKCTLTGQFYDKHKGCRCKWGKEYSTEYKKCIPKCKYGEVYNDHSGKCEKPFSCKGDNYEIVDNYGEKECKCKLEGQYYDEHYGCKCKDGYEFSEKYHKCIEKCEHYEVYNEHTGKCEKPFSCKGKNVEIVTDGYGAKSCKCKIEGQVYNKWKGCQCPKDTSYSSKWNKCVPDCKYGYEYDGHECKPICKTGAWYEHGKCKCKKGQYYDESYGCKNYCDGDATYDYHSKQCECPYGKEYVKGKGCVDKCKTPAYFKHGECKCPDRGQYYDEHYGCKDRCPAGTSYDWHKKECKCDTYGQVYDKSQKKCYTPCKGKDVKLVWKNYQPTCVCTKEGYEYTKWGCKSKCKWGEKYDSNHKACYKPCGHNEKLVWNYGHATCVCKDGYEKTKWGCKKKEESHYGGY